MLSLILEYRDEAQRVAFWAVCLAALFKGGGPERAISITLIAIFVVTDTIYHALTDNSFSAHQVDIFHASNDLLAGVLLILIALHANRIYPMWIASFQLLAALAHVARELADQISPIAYVIMVSVPSYFQIGILAGGVILHIRRRRLFGRYRDWRPGVGTQGWIHTLSTFGQKT